MTSLAEVALTMTAESKRQSLQARRDRERDFRCQFLAATLMGAAGIAMGCAGTGMIVYGVPNAEQLGKEADRMIDVSQRDATLSRQITLMLFGRLGGVLLGIGIFLLIVFGVIGFDYKQYLSRRRPRPDTRSVMNRRFYADILRSIQTLGDDDLPGDQDARTTAEVVADREEESSSQPPTGANQKAGSSMALALVLATGENFRPGAAVGRRANSLRMADVVEMAQVANKEERRVASAGGNAATGKSRVSSATAGRANEAFDALEEFNGGVHRLRRSCQSLRGHKNSNRSNHSTSSSSSNGSSISKRHPPAPYTNLDNHQEITSLDQLFLVETEFNKRLGQQQKQLLEAQLNNLNAPNGHHHSKTRKSPMQRYHTDEEAIISLADITATTPNIQQQQQQDNSSLETYEEDNNLPPGAPEALNNSHQESVVASNYNRRIRAVDSLAEQNRTATTTSIQVQVHVHLNDHSPPRTASAVAAGISGTATATVNGSKPHSVRVNEVTAGLTKGFTVIQAIEADGVDEF